MMKYCKWLWILGLVVLATGCKPEESQRISRSFNASVEQLDDESKVRLIDESWVYWEAFDEISVAGDLDPQAEIAYLQPGSNGNPEFADYNAVFITILEENSNYFLGLFPHNGNNYISSHAGTSNFDGSIIYLNPTQAYRDDHTFGRNVMPMVAWYGGNGDSESDPYTPFNLDFHLLGGIVRLQLFNQSGSSVTLDHITITSREGEKLSGRFNVKRYNTHEPYLEGGENEYVTLSCGEDGIALGNNDLATFYLVLPALGGNNVTTNYKLTMDAVTTSGLHCTKNFTAQVRRTGMTNMRALGVTEWTAGGGGASAGLAGCGTSDRPFKVYNVADLQYLRDCYNSTARTINNQPITANTWIALMRSDIVLDDDNWNEGINNFVGHLTDRTHQSHPGITIRSMEPLFTSIAQGGEVDGISLKCRYTYTNSPGIGVTPFCSTNLGTISNCVLTTDPSAPQERVICADAPLAGLCIENWGTISGCRNEARMEVQQQKDVAGICLTNHSDALITGCQVSSEMSVYATSNSHVAGICLENLAGGTIKDCYFATSVTSTGVNDATWAGIVFSNAGTVEHCYLSATGHIYTQKSVGGIVYENTGGKVDYCWVAGPMSGLNAGGIVCNLSGGKVINCFNQLNAMLTINTASGIGGGLVGSMTGGSIENSYINNITIIRLNEAATTGGIVGNATGGTMNNCYDFDDDHLFFGSKNAATTITNSYVVGGNQTTTGLTIVQPTAYVTMQENLNAHIPTGGKEWEGAENATTSPANAGTPPQLEPYTITPPPDPEP